MNLPKYLFKSGWLVIGSAQALLAALYHFELAPGLAQLAWWQLYTPGLWLLFWLALWQLSLWGRAAWNSFRLAQRKGSVAVDKRNLVAARQLLTRAIKDHGPASPAAIDARANVRRLEARLRVRAEGK